jgi:hypothetical protein
LAFGVTLIESFLKNYPNSHIYVLCLDKKSFTDTTDYFGTNSKLHLITLNELFKKYPILKTAKSNRNKIEFYWTLTPFLTEYALDKSKSTVFYVDADVYFFSKSKELGVFHSSKKSIYLQKIVYQVAFKRILEKKYGKFIVALNGFKYTPVALDCLDKWKKDCFTRCVETSDGEHYGDQLYLNGWPSIYSKYIYYSSNIGDSAAPWHINYYKTTKKLSNFYLDNKKLISYHFHGIIFNNKGYIPCKNLYVKPEAIKIYDHYYQTIKPKLEKFGYEFVDKKYGFKAKNSFWGTKLHYWVFDWWFTKTYKV